MTARKSLHEQYLQIEWDAAAGNTLDRSQRRKHHTVLPTASSGHAATRQKKLCVELRGHDSAQFVDAAPPPRCEVVIQEINPEAAKRAEQVENKAPYTTERAGCIVEARIAGVEGVVQFRKVEPDPPPFEFAEPTSEPPRLATPEDQPPSQVHTVASQPALGKEQANKQKKKSDAHGGCTENLSRSTDGLD
jgi:hypothetical protein